MAITRSRNLILVSLTLATVAGAIGLPGAQNAAGAGPLGVAGPQPSALHADANHVISQLPLLFEPNAGRSGPAADFVARGNGFAAAIAARRLAVATPRANLHMRLQGASGSAAAVPGDKVQGATNAYIGANASSWASSLASYGRVGYDNVYPGIDLSYTGDRGHLEYAFTVAPGATSRSIALSFPGSTGVHKGGAGGLVLRVPHSKQRLRWRHPVAYQQSPGGARTAVRVRFDLQGQRDGAGFSVGDHDPSRPLVIDPSIAYSTYLGGANQETGRAVDITSSGDMVAVGSTTSVNFPTLNPAQSAYSGFEQDLVIARISAAGSLAYSTYLGGNGDDNPRDVVLDPSGNAWVAGFGNSNDFPTVNPLQAQNAGGGNDWYLSELSPTGSLLYSTYVGGKGKDGKPHVALGTDGSIYLAGYSSGAFPTTPGAFQSVAHGDVDDLFVKLAPGGSHSIVYATYLGGAGNDTSRGVQVDPAGDLYSAGWTESSDFPVTAGAYQPTFGGMRDATMLKLDPSGQPVYSTYLGGSDVDGPYPGDSVAIDAAGNAYVTGWVTSTNFPLMNPIQSTIGSLTLHDVFVAKFSPSGSLLFSTYFGGTTVDEGAAIDLDAVGNIYVTGTTSSQNWPTLNSIQPTKPGSGDGFLLKISPTYQLVFSTWLGGGGVDTAEGLAVDAAGDAFIAGYTTSNNFPTHNPLQATNAGKQDMFISEIAPGPASSPSPTPSPSSSPTSSPSPSPSPSPTGSPSPSPTGSPSPSPSSSPSSSPTSSPSPGTKPNIVFILTDDQRWDTIGRCLPAVDANDYNAGSNACMPFLQQDLMPNGVTFKRGYVTTSLCCPSRASILTGQYQEHHHVVDNNGFAEFDDSSTLPIWLQSAGYKTGLFGKYLNGYGEAGQPNYEPPGWDSWHAFFGGVGYKTYPLLEKDPGGSLALSTYSDQNTTNNTACATGNLYSTDFLCRKALDFLAANTGSPFFLYFAPLSPHTPSTPPRRYTGVYSGLQEPEYPNYNQVATPHTPSWIQKTPYSPTSLNQIEVGYRHALETNRAADDSINALYQQVASEGKLSNTVWVFMSDNGVAAGEHWYNDKSCEYEECHKVPFVVACPPAVCPGATPGLVDSTHPVLNIDLAPTFAALAGATPTIPVDGTSLLPLLNNPATSWRTTFHISDAGGKPGLSSGIYSDQPDGHTYKYVNLPATGDHELYDLTADPWELNNLAGDGVHTALETQLSTALTSLLTPPSITISGPPAFTNLPGASFSWTSSKSATFTCTLDAGPAAPCGSGLSGALSFPSISTGPHSFTVKAQDLDNNFGTSTDTFTVDRTAPPAATFTQTPANPSGATVTFAFTDAEAGSTFTCSLDGAAASACTSPKTYSGLSNGPHTLAVLAIDAAGNPASTSSTFSWTATVAVDTTPPTVNMSAPKPDEILTSHKVSVTWNGTDDVGITGYSLAERVGTGGSQSTVYSGLGKSFTKTGNLGTTYCYAVTAFDAAAHSTTTPERCAVVPMDDRNASITYLGSVAQEAPAVAFESTLSVLDASGEEADLSFTGRSVGILAEKTSGSGRFQVYIDGTLAKTVDLYSATSKNAALVFQQAVTPGTHSLRVVWIAAKNSSSTGHRVGLDAIGVIQ